MIEKLKENWFVCLVAVLLVGAVGFYAYDQNKGKLPGKTVDGKDVVATFGEETVLADDLYNDLYGDPASSKAIGTQILYMHFERAVVDAAIDTDYSLQVATQVTAIKQSYQNYYGDNWEAELLKGLQGSGYASLDDLDDYFTHLLKLDEMARTAFDANLEELFTPIYEEKSPRTVSHILVKMENPDEPTEEEQKKIDDIEKALADGTDFTEVAKTYSDDTSAEQGGFLGYADKDTNFVPEFKEAMLAQEKGVVGEWVTSDYGRHLILVNETDKAALLADEDIRESIYSAVQKANPTYMAKVLWDKAQELGVTFADASYETALKEYLGIQD